jgi:hypothetical protein
MDSAKTKCMKTFKYLTCTFVMVAIIAFWATDAKAASNFTTNYDTLNITVIIATNTETFPKANVDMYTIHKFTLNNAAILSMLEGPDWNDATFPAGSKLVVSWDAGANVKNGSTGDILVVDKTGTNVLYDASDEASSKSGKAYLTIDFYYQYGAYTENDNYNNPGHYDFTWLNDASFEIYDRGESLIVIDTSGPSTEIYSQGWKSFDANDHLDSDFASWSDSEHATTYCANGEIGGFEGANVTVQISATGHGPGLGGYFAHPL